MLTYDPAERASALECINHPFLADVKEGEEEHTVEPQAEPQAEPEPQPSPQ